MAITTKVSNQKEILVCRLGIAEDEEPLNFARCAWKNFCKPEQAEEVLPIGLKEISPAHYIMTLGKIQGALNIVRSSSENSLIIDRLDTEGKYSLSVPIAKKKDSGGPWLLKQDDSSLAVAGVFSLTEYLAPRIAQ